MALNAERSSPRKSRPQEFALNIDNKNMSLPVQFNEEASVIRSKSFDSPRSRVSTKPDTPTSLSRSIFDAIARSEPHSPSVSNSEVTPLIRTYSGSGVSILPVSFPVSNASVHSVKRHFLLGTSSASANKERKEKVRAAVNEGGEFFLWLWSGSRHSGVMCMALAAVIYALMGVLVETFAVQEIPSYETLFVRCGVVAIASYLVPKQTGHSLIGAPAVRPLLLARSAIGFISVSGFLYSLSVLPLPVAASISVSTPVITALLAPLSLQESWEAKELGGLLLGFLGATLILQPFPLFGYKTADAPSAATSFNALNFGIDIALAVALVAAVFGGAAYCCIRVLGKAGESPQVTVLAFGAFSCPAAALCLFLFQEFVMPGIVQLCGLMLSGLMAFVCQMLLARGLQLERAAKVTSVLYIKVVTTYLLDAFLLGQPLSLHAVAGISLVALSTSSTIFWSSDRASE